MGRGLSVSFDLDGTLTSNRFVDLVWLEGVPGLVARKRGIDPDHARRLCIEEYAKVGEDSILWYRLPYWLDYFDLKEVTPEGLVSMYTSEIELFDDAIPALETLKAEGFPLILFSNATRIFLDAEVSSGALEPYFDRIISVSDDWGMVKANPEAYARLKGIVSGRLVHVGDHERLDYEVPLSLGVEAYHICRNHEKPVAGGCIADLRKFAVIINSIGS